MLANKSGSVKNISRLMVFKIGGKAALPAPPPEADRVLDPPPLTATPQQVAQGAKQYGLFCSTCHGDAAVSGGLNPDLRHSGALNDAKVWQAIVHDGALKENGMVAWSPVMSADQIETIRAYVIKRAIEDKALQEKATQVASR